MGDKKDEKDYVLPKPPFRMVIAGPSMSGKTRFLINTLADLPKWDNVVLMSPEMSAEQDDYKTLEKQYGTEKVMRIVGLPNEELTKILFEQLDEGKKLNQTSLFIIDDLMEDAKKSKFISNLATAACHHLGISFVLIQQTIMLANIGRTVRLNSDYIIVFSIPMDKRAFTYVAQQMEPDHWKEITDKYKEVTAKPYQPFIIDIKSFRDGLPKKFHYRDGDWKTGIEFPF